MSVTFLTNEDEIKYIKTVNGATPDENGNVEINSGSGSSWSDIKDKPVILECTDTLTWDGNTEGLASYETGINTVMYKVSDAIVRYEDIASGWKIVSGNGFIVTNDPDNPYMLVDGPTRIEINNHGTYFDMSALARFVNTPVELNGVVLDPGVYLLGNVDYISALTINGYAGFGGIEKIDPKVLPKHLQLVETTISEPSSTLTWDGNTEGLVSWNMPDTNSVLYKVSDAIVRYEDIASGWTIVSSNGLSVTNAPDNPYAIVVDNTRIEINNHGTHFSIYTLALFVNTSVDMNGVVLDPGVYLYSDGLYVSTFTINGFSGFDIKKSIKTFDEQYVPHVSWNKISSKPFIDAQSTDTLIWNGNTDGLLGVDVDGTIMYKISDANIKYDDVGNEATCNIPSMEVSTTVNKDSEFFGPICDGVFQLFGGIFFVSEEAVGVDLDGIIFPEAGTYAPYELTMGSEVHIRFPGYSVFNVPEKINESAIPESIARISYVAASYVDKTNFTNLVDRVASLEAVNYLTEEDRPSLVADVIAALPTWNGGSY